MSVKLSQARGVQARSGHDTNRRTTLGYNRAYSRDNKVLFFIGLVCSVVVVYSTHNRLAVRKRACEVPPRNNIYPAPVTHIVTSPLVQGSLGHSPQSKPLARLIHLLDIGAVCRWSIYLKVVL